MKCQVWALKLGQSDSEVRAPAKLFGLVFQRDRGILQSQPTPAGRHTNLTV